MKVIICGAGQVGFNIARYLASENADVTVIDQSRELIEKITDSLDVKGLVGFASHPDVLESAGAADAEMVIAVTYADEVNRSEEHTSELQSLMRNSYAVFCFKKKKNPTTRK